MATRTWWAGFGINLKIVLEGDSLTVYHELVEEVPPDVTDYVDPDREKSRSIAIPAAGGCVSAPPNPIVPRLDPPGGRMNGRFGQDTDAALRNYQSDHAGGILEFGPDISAMEPEIIPASAVVRPAIPATNQYY